MENNLKTIKTCVQLADDTFYEVTLFVKTEEGCLDKATTPAEIVDDHLNQIKNYTQKSDGFLDEMTPFEEKAGDRFPKTVVYKRNPDGSFREMPSLGQTTDKVFSEPETFGKILDVLFRKLPPSIQKGVMYISIAGLLAASQVLGRSFRVINDPIAPVTGVTYAVTAPIGQLTRGLRQQLRNNESVSGQILPRSTSPGASSSVAQQRRSSFGQSLSMGQVRNLVITGAAVPLRAPFTPVFVSQQMPKVKLSKCPLWYEPIQRGFSYSLEAGGMNADPAIYAIEFPQKDGTIKTRIGESGFVGQRLQQHRTGMKNRSGIDFYSYQEEFDKLQRDFPELAALNPDGKVYPRIFIIEHGSKLKEQNVRMKREAYYKKLVIKDPNRILINKERY